MSTTVYQYIVYCITEGQYVTYWGTSPPTTCPNNNTHTIDPNSISIQQTISEDTIKTNEVNVGKLFQHSSAHLDIPAGTPGSVVSMNLSWPMDINLWQTTLYPLANNLYDVINILIAPNTTLGVLTQNANIGDTLLNVSNTAFTFEYMYKGLIVTLTDGVNTFNAGRITSINSTSLTITVENPLTVAFTAGSTYFQISIQIVRDKIFHQTTIPEHIGNKGFNSMPIQAGTVMQVQYTNMDGTAKTLYTDLEYYYV